jgi:hypothetical protein
MLFRVVKLGPPGLRIIRYIGCKRSLICKTRLQTTMRYYQRLQPEELKASAESCEHDDAGTDGSDGGGWVSAEADLVVRRLCKCRKEKGCIRLRRVVYDATVTEETPSRAAYVGLYIG